MNENSVFVENKDWLIIANKLISKAKSIENTIFLRENPWLKKLYEWSYKYKCCDIYKYKAIAVKNLETLSIEDDWINK